MIEVNKFKIGVFVIAGIAAILGGIFLFGGDGIFKKEVKLVTIYDESVQGLEKGSQVKFRGVSIGKVTEVVIMQNNSKVMIKMQIDPSAFVPPKTDDAEIMLSSVKEQKNDLRMFIRNQIKKGLQARLEFAGITGFKYVELNYFNAAADKLLPEPTGLEYDEIYIAAAPSILSDAVHNISTSLENISKIRFDKISASLENSTSKINEFLNDESLQDTANNIKNITAKLDKVLTDERLDLVMNDLQNILREFKEISAEFNKEAHISRTAKSIRNAGDAVVQSSENLENTLFKLNSTLDKLSSLLSLLNENPSAVLRGKEAESVKLK